MPGRIHFGVYELDPEAMELRKRGVLIRLQEQPLRVLIALAERPGEIVTREELQAKIWGKDTFVDFEQSLNKAVNRLREALNDDAAQPRYVETVPRRGYRFMAPVTANTATEPGSETTSSIVVSSLDIKESQPRKSGLRKAAAPTMVALLLALGITGVLLLRKPRTPTLQETRHMSAGCCPALSRDGKLLAYISSAGSDVRHIWVQQTAGGEAIPVTRGPDTDYWPDFSPDGTHIAFVSTKGGGGIYVTPTLPGESKLIVKRALGYQGTSLGGPRFSPSGDKILYWEDESKAVTVAVGGGPPTLLDLNRDFRVDGPPRWSPSGNQIFFYGVRKGETEKPGAWWIASLDGGDPRPLHVSGVAESVYSIAAWIRAKDEREWIVYYSISSVDAWNMLRVRISPQGRLDEKPEPLTSGTGRIGFGASISEDGKIAYFTAPSLSTSIYEIPTNDRGQKLGPTLQLPLSAEGGERSPSVSRDGRWLAYNAIQAGKPNTILLRDLAHDTDRFVDDKGREPGSVGEVSISPDGSKLIFERNCKSGRFGPLEGPLPCGFLVSAAGGEPEQVCEFCTPRGFSSNGSVILLQKYDRTGSKPHDRIVALDLAARTEKDFLDVPGKDLYHAYFSWDDHWVVFKQSLGLKGQIFIAPVRNGVAGREAEWIAVTDGRSSDDKPQFSPDGNTAYFTSTRDGYLCIWAQKLDPATKRPVRSAVAYEHFHNSMGRDAADPDWQGDSDLVVARDKILINLSQIRTDIWMTHVE